MIDWRICSIAFRKDNRLCISKPATACQLVSVLLSRNIADLVAIWFTIHILACRLTVHMMANAHLFKTNLYQSLGKVPAATQE